MILGSPWLMPATLISLAPKSIASVVILVIYNKGVQVDREV